MGSYCAGRNFAEYRYERTRSHAGWRLSRARQSKGLTEPALLAARAASQLDGSRPENKIKSSCSQQHTQTKWGGFSRARERYSPHEVVIVLEGDLSSLATSTSVTARRLTPPRLLPFSLLASADEMFLGVGGQRRDGEVQLAADELRERERFPVPSSGIAPFRLNKFWSPHLLPPALDHAPHGLRDREHQGGE